MSTANLHTDVAAVQSALATAVTDASAFIAYAVAHGADSASASSHDGGTVQVNVATELLKALSTCQQLLAPSKYGASSAIDHTVTTG